MQITALRRVFNQLVNDRHIKTQSELAEKTGFDEVSMSMMLTGKKPLPVRLLKSLHETFGVDANFLLTDGQGEIYLRPAATGDEPLSEELQNAMANRVRAEVLQQDLADCKKQLKDKDRIIELQYNELDRLKNVG
jgi:transcriptional regulator with XRE-family HTH domain